jgi:hypothetical protein
MAVPPHDGKRSCIVLPSYSGQASHAEMVGCQAGFFAQSSALITYLKIISEIGSTKAQPVQW